MRVQNILGPLMALLLTPFFSESSHSKELELVSLGVRGAVNFQDAGLPPGEKEDFEQFDVFGIIGLPWSWEYPSGWEMRWRLNGSVGALRGAGDVGFITTVTPGLAFTKKEWRLTLDVGGGGALLSKWEFGRQDIGGPFQFIGHGGISFHLPGNLVAGYRFHHVGCDHLWERSRGGSPYAGTQLLL